jgi:hypothetical protein
VLRFIGLTSIPTGLPYGSIVFAYNTVSTSCKIKYKNRQGPIYWKIPPPPRGGKISADVIWGKKYEKVKRKRGKM